MPDLLHPNEKGYQIWADAMEGLLAPMLKEEGGGPIPGLYRLGPAQRGLSPK
jgi:hypothetical protein